MGNIESIDITNQAEHEGKDGQENQANGHAVSNLDMTDAVTSQVSVQQKSETPSMTATVKTKSKPKSVVSNGFQASSTAASVEATNDATTVSSEKNVEAEAINKGQEETPQPAEKPNIFNKMFKKKDSFYPATERNEAAEEQTEGQKSVSVQQQSETPSMTATVKTKSKPKSVVNNGPQASSTAASAKATNDATTVSSEKNVEAEATNKGQEETPQPAEKPNIFNKMFKKKDSFYPATERNEAAEEQTKGQKSEPPDIKASPQAVKEPQGDQPKPSSTEDAPDGTPPAETNQEENSVMNFFKSFKVTPTKTTKVAANPDVSKEQSQKETPPAQAANVQEAAKAPPPPPPAPPKMESKAEPAVKKEGGQAAAAPTAKVQETPSKAKAKESTFGKLFRGKSVVKEEAKPVEVQADASKASTLQATAKSEPPPAPKLEEKKPEKKPSPFANLLKPKVLLGQVSSRIQAAATSAASSISLGAGRGATEPKKEGPASPAAAPEAASSTKVKEEPKPAAAAAAPTAAASPDNKSVGSDNPSPSIPRKLEKRNSIQLFFKNLGQKRHSDAEVQTDAPVAPEKTK